MWSEKLMLWMVWMVIALGASRCDNFHSQGRGEVFCNGVCIETRDLQANERWKISYLGCRENIKIREEPGALFIEGLAKTNSKEIRTKDTIYFPEGLEVVIHSDRIYTIRGKNVPKKVVSMTIALAVCVLSALVVFVHADRVVTGTGSLHAYGCV